MWNNVEFAYNSLCYQTLPHLYPLYVTHILFDHILLSKTQGSFINNTNIIVIKYPKPSKTSFLFNRPPLYQLQ